MSSRSFRGDRIGFGDLRETSFASVRRRETIDGTVTLPDPLVDALLAKDPWLRREARRRARDPEAAEDLVQEVWVAALDRRPACDRELEPWLQRVLDNRCARSRRDRARRPQSAEDALGSAAGGAAADDELWMRERHAHLRTLVDALEEPYRTTLAMRFFDERTVAEIARLTTEPRATISTRLRRGLGRLRRSLGDRRALPALGFLGSRRALPVSGLLVAGGLTIAWVALAHDRVDAPRRRGTPATVARLVRPTAAGGRRTTVAQRTPGTARDGVASSRATAEGLARRTVVVRDGATGEPRAELHVELEHPRGARVALATDASGELALPVGWGDKTLVATFGAAQRHRLRPRRWIEPGSVAVELGRGPVVTLRSPRFEAFGPGALHWRLRRAEPGAFGYPPLTAGPGRRPGERSVQLPLDLEHHRIDELALCVTTPDGLAGGIVALEDAALRGETALDVEWRALASFALRLRAPDGSIVRDGVAWLRPLGARSAWPLEPDLADERGWVRIAPLEPGEYELRVDCPPFPIVTDALWLVEGEPMAHDTELDPPPESGEIRGRLVSQSTECREDLIAVLESDRTPRFVPLIWREAPGGLEAPFVFTDVAAASYQLRVVALETLRAIDPPVHYVRPGGPIAEFAYRDEDPVEDLAFVVRAVGTPLDEFVLDVRVGESTAYRIVRGPADELGQSRWLFGTHGLSWSSRTGPALPSVPIGAHVQWTLTSFEYGSASGDETAFANGVAHVDLCAAPAAAGD